MSTYSSLQSPLSNVLNTWMGNPLANSTLQGQIGMGANQINTQTAAQNQALTSNAATSGKSMASQNPFLQGMQNQIGRAATGSQYNNFMSQLLGANTRQLQTTGMAQNYNPLMTGSTGTQTQSGLGTWLPQVLAAAGKAAMMGAAG